jgi:hypothetical protein
MIERLQYKLVPGCFMSLSWPWLGQHCGWVAEFELGGRVAQTLLSSSACRIEGNSISV